MLRIKTENSKGKVYTLQDPRTEGFWITIFRKNGGGKTIILEAKGLSDAALNHLELCKSFLK